MAVRALNVSARELAGGIEEFEQLAKICGIPLLSANIVNKKNGEPRFPDHLITTAAGKNIYLIGFTRPVIKTWLTSDGDEIIITDPAERLPGLIEKGRGQADLVILLAHYPLRKLEKLLAQLPPVDVVIGGDGYSVTREKTVINGALVSYAGKEGQYLSMISFIDQELQHADQLHFHLNTDLPEDDQIAGIVEGCQK